MSKKVRLGQFFTTSDVWLKPHILKFIVSSNCSTGYDPFAGNGDLLKALEKHGFKRLVGLDIDPCLSWKINDSLMNIPSLPNAIIATNPPYLAKQSASRKKIDMKKYFLGSGYDDVYLIALSIKNV